MEIKHRKRGWSARLCIAYTEKTRTSDEFIILLQADVVSIYIPSCMLSAQVSKVSYFPGQLRALRTRSTRFYGLRDWSSSARGPTASAPGAAGDRNP